MSFFKHVQLHKYDITDKGIKQACLDEMKAEGYDIVITEKEMQVLAAHRCEEFKDYMRPLFAQEVNVMRDYYAYNLTSDEDCCLMMMLEFFEDLGLPDDFDPKAFESLSKKFYDNLK